MSENESVEEVYFSETDVLLGYLLIIPFYAYLAGKAAAPMAKKALVVSIGSVLGLIPDLIWGDPLEPQNHS